MPKTKTEPQEYIELIKIVADALESVRQGFDNYQNACFEAKPPEFFCLELNGEAGELANIEKKAWKGKEIPHEEFEDEAADVLIALMNYCNAKGINLGDSVRRKLMMIEEKRSFLEKNNQKY